MLERRANARELLWIVWDARESCVEFSGMCARARVSLVFQATPFVNRV